MLIKKAKRDMCVSCLHQKIFLKVKQTIWNSLIVSVNLNKLFEKASWAVEDSKYYYDK